MQCPTLTQRAGGPPVARPLVLAIMDGIGLGPGDEGDAVAAATTPNLDRYAQSPLAGRLAAHGQAVGMPSDDDMGNSEVGHNAMGAGRVFDQGAALVRRAIADQSIYAGEAWAGAMRAAQAGALHLVGLVSDGNVHSHIDHLLALIRRAHQDGARAVYVHALLDGRDVARTSAPRFLQALEATLAPLHRPPARPFRIASGGGRMQITMDRYQADWAMVERGWRLQVEGKGRAFASAGAALEALRAESPGIGDQDLPGFVVHDQAGRPAPVAAGDAVIAFNFRGDRMLELCEAFEADHFTHFKRGPRPDVFFAGMTQYDGDLKRPRNFLVTPPEIRCTLSELLAGAGRRQLAISETQKFGHVTYFWSGNRSGAFDAARELAIEVPSRPPPFDHHPEMAAPEIVERTLLELAGRSFDFVRVNLPNGDMVGHTGNFAATVRAVETVDACLGRLEEVVVARGGALVITGDHGNAEQMLEPADGDGGPRAAKTSHTLNPVPLYLAAPPRLAAGLEIAGIERPGLGNLASTLAVLMGFAPPPHMLPPVWRPRAEA